MITGHCLCRRVTYEYKGEPLFQVICCCVDCQLASGSSHVPAVGAIKELFEVKGNPKAFVSIGGSGKNAIRNFCPDCGSLLFGTPESNDGLVTIYAGTISRDFIFTPTMVINTKSKAHWEVFGSDMTLIEGMPQR
jgi:hypothetical protein